jgi:hypothetical protein
MTQATMRKPAAEALFGVLEQPFIVLAPGQTSTP